MIPPWLVEIKKAEGDSESNDLPEIIAWIEEVDPTIKHKVAWCAATMRHFIKKAGLSVKGLTLAAVSFLAWGRKLNGPEPGAIVIFLWRQGEPDAGGHHVSCVDDNQDGVPKGMIACIGGNQHHMIKRSIYPRGSVIGYRMPADYKQGT